MSPWPDDVWASDPVRDQAAAREAWLRRQANLGRGWHPDQWQPADLLRQLGDQALDPAAEATEIRSRAYVAERMRLADLDGPDEVRGPDAALDWLASHATVNLGPEMSPPAAVLAAIAMVSGRVVCVERCGAISVRYDEERDCIASCHPYADCPDVVHPASPAAIALAEFVQCELARFVALADYGEPLPLNEWAAL